MEQEKNHHHQFCGNKFAQSKSNILCSLFQMKICGLFFFIFQQISLVVCSQSGVEKIGRK